MAVYKRTYQGYEGRLTPARWRFLIIPRYACGKMFDSRFLIFLFFVCLAWPAVCAALIYLRHNEGAINLFGLSLAKLVPIDGRFFFHFMGWQGTLAFLVTAFVGPGLISRDLANNALPLYFCRPLSRAEYVTGKASVLVIPLSAITWIPGLLLFGFNASLEGRAWLAENLWIANGIFLGSWIWMLTLCLLSLALSAWVKWKLAAGALLFGIFFAAAGFGQAINEILNTKSGSLINITELIRTIWCGLFQQRIRTGLSEASAWTMLMAICGVSLWLLAKKVRAYEVERS